MGVEDLDQTFTLREIYDAIEGTDTYLDAIAVLVRGAEKADQPPEQEVIVLMTAKDYDTAERNLSEAAKMPVKTETGDWYCWSMGLGAYWKPSPADRAQGWPGHTIRCGRYEVAPWPLEEEDPT